MELEELGHSFWDSISMDKLERLLWKFCHFVVVTQ